ncbi:MAG: DNA-binding protein [Acidobacteria bacterium]|nr:MAG: DNA-binding protein [Acidobacteriota bacterium]
MKEADKRTEFLTARQLAEILQVSESTVHRLRRRGRIPAIMLTSRLIRFNLNDVKAALGLGAKRSTPHHQQDEHSDQLSFDDVFAGFSEE